MIFVGLFLIILGALCVVATGSLVRDTFKQNTGYHRFDFNEVLMSAFMTLFMLGGGFGSLVIGMSLLD